MLYNLYYAIKLLFLVQFQVLGEHLYISLNILNENHVSLLRMKYHARIVPNMKYNNFIFVVNGATD